MVIPQSLVPIGLSIMVLLVVIRLLTGGDRTSSGGSGTLMARRDADIEQRSPSISFFPRSCSFSGCRSFSCCWSRASWRCCSSPTCRPKRCRPICSAASTTLPLLAVPFFVLAGEIMAQGGIARRVVVWVISVIGGIRGSLAVTTVAASELFGAMAHTAVGTVVAVGRMIYPSLREGGYSERFSVG